jgi:TonB family protein
MLFEFLTYDLKVAVLIAVFYMFYRLLLAKETFHRVNRIVLLLTAVASFVLPLCVITMHKTVTMPSIGVEVGPVVATEIQSDATGYQDLQSALIYLFIIGMVVCISKTLWSVFKILSLIRKSEQHPQTDGTTICVTGNADLAPFSWMHYIVMNRSDYVTNDAAILAHEQGHIRLRHSWDVLLVDFLTALQWFNPAIWMLRSDLRAIHEYEADGAVLSQGINARQYQYLLITKAGGIGGYSLANGISHSTLKNRITMMLHTESPRRRLLKLLALLPVVGVTLALNARTVTDYVYDEPQKQQPVKKGKKGGTIKMGGNQTIQVMEEDKIDNKQTVANDEIVSVETIVSDDKEVFDVVEVMPQFPGGAPKLMEYLSQNIRYPKEAMEADKQGRVLVTFVVGKDGSISDARVVKSVDEALDAEALRVISAMPDWTPGTQSGKAVNVKYTVPITFRLDGKAKETPTATGSFTPNTEVNGEEVDGEKPKAIRHTVKYVKVDGQDAMDADVEVICNGKKITPADMQKINPDDIKSIEVLKKDNDHPKDRILITMKK